MPVSLGEMAKLLIPGLRKIHRTYDVETDMIISVPADDIPSDVTYEWKRVESWGLDNGLQMFAERGWIPVPQQRHPTVKVEQEGLRLMEKLKPGAPPLLPPELTVVADEVGLTAEERMTVRKVRHMLDGPSEAELEEERQKISMATVQKALVRSFAASKAAMAAQTLANSSQYQSGGLGGSPLAQAQNQGFNQQMNYVDIQQYPVGIANYLGCFQPSQLGSPAVQGAPPLTPDTILAMMKNMGLE